MRRLFFFGGLTIWLVSCGNNAGTTSTADTTTVNTITTTDNSAVGVDTNYGTTPGSDTLMVGSGR